MPIVYCNILYCCPRIVIHIMLSDFCQYIPLQSTLPNNPFDCCVRQTVSCRLADCPDFSQVSLIQAGPLTRG